ncbi:Hypothetical protein R9X50_00141500 [Acrodontium crateriforme]|uniref:Uncharacterized protein n=1 Tax=Acrodontium crateriforme TaxID=150365 RepID=A0AAQ3LZP6_9PEZI|nr:Hypothetical protein R9X50_00141500 [Acrodontium crateriforme]
METAIRWSPLSTTGRQRFLTVDVVNPTLSLHEVDDIEDRAVSYDTVSTCEKLPNFGAFAWNPIDDSIVALGLVSGNACLVRLSDDKQSTGVINTFKIKQQRKCNSVAFSTQQMLAVALDKIRSDVCLNVYDASRGTSGYQDPVRRLCPAEVVSSVRFSPNQPHEIVAGVQRSFIRLYDIRDGYMGGGGNTQVTTKHVSNIAIDPCDSNYFAAAALGVEASVQVWDKRWISQPSSSSNQSPSCVFQISPVVENNNTSTLWSLRYSGQQRGRLALCSSAGEVKVIDMVEGRTSILQASEYVPNNPHGGTPWTHNRYVSQTRILERPWNDERRGREVHTRVVAFDWMSDGEAISNQGMITLRANRRIETFHVMKSIPQAQITARQDLSIGLRDLSVTESTIHTGTTPPAAPYERSNSLGSAEDFGPIDYDGEDTDLMNSPARRLHYQRDSPQIGRFLAASMQQRDRCRRGYLFDCDKNMKVVAGHWQLERLWEIVNRFREQAADDAMVYESMDLSYVGVYGLWTEVIGGNANRQLSQPSIRVDEAIFGLNTSKEVPAFEGERTSFPDNRQMCLAVCGWRFSVETLEAECQELIDRGLYYQAIVQAVLHEYRHVALNFLRTLIRSKTIPNIGLGPLLASDTINEEQREMCMWMAADTEDPALKALLTFLAAGDWRDVMKTNYLHLGYRVALGLKYLNDTELSGFIRSETARAIKNGDLEGILLTGLGEQAMDLFQTYIVKTNDLQTAVLATAFTNPRYVDDMRWEIWRDTYFEQMQTWRAFNERTKFTVQHSFMAKTREGHSMISTAPAQVVLRCNHCQGALSRHSGRQMLENSSTHSDGHVARVSGPAANSGTVCPHCGRHMPRCVICTMWLGTPSPLRSEGPRPQQKVGDTMASFLSFCVNCGHGFHANHAHKWFKKRNICPAPDCQCVCRLK